MSYEKAVVDTDRKLAYIVAVSATEKVNGSRNLYFHRFANSEGVQYGWTAICPREFAVGSVCVFFEVDSVLDPTEGSPTKFLCDLKLSPVKRAKVFKNNYTDGLLVLASELGLDLPVDTDVTEVLKVRKFVSESEAPLYASTSTTFAFPSDVKKTDEPRLASYPTVLSEMGDSEIVITQKYDGTSCTLTKDQEHLVCSRNQVCPYDAKSVYWRIFAQYKFDKVLDENPDLAFQGEIVGPKIQGNPLKLEAIKYYIFNVQDRKTQKYLSVAEIDQLCEKYALDQVKRIGLFKASELTMDSLQELSDSQHYDSGNFCEGIVAKTIDGPHISFKVISRNYK